MSTACLTICSAAESTVFTRIFVLMFLMWVLIVPFFMPSLSARLPVLSTSSQSGLITCSSLGVNPRLLRILSQVSSVKLGNFLLSSMRYFLSHLMSFLVMSLLAPVNHLEFFAGGRGLAVCETESWSTKTIQVEPLYLSASTLFPKGAKYFFCVCIYFWYLLVGRV